MEEENLGPNAVYVDVTPSWEGLVMPLVNLAMNGETWKDREFALLELKRMARIADLNKNKVN